MKQFATLLCILVLLFSTSAFAQLSGPKNIPGDYPDLSSAITDLNTQGVGAGGVTLNLVAGNPQTAPAGGYVIGDVGSLVLTTATPGSPIVIQGNGNTITAGAQAAGSLIDAVFKLIGADYTTITGCTMQENAANTDTTLATNTKTEWGVAMLHVDVTDGCQHNTIQGNAISLDRVYRNSVGIYSNNRHSSTAVGIAEEITNGTTAPCSNNAVYSNIISNVSIGMCFVGSGVAANMDANNDIGGTSLATGNTISNWGGAGHNAGYVSITTSSVGVYLNHQLSENVSYNILTSANVAPTGTFLGIFCDYTSDSPAGSFTNNITNNTVTMTNSFVGATGTQIQCIRQSNTFNTANAGITVNMNNNTILNCAVTGVNSLVSIFGILNTANFGTVNMNSNVLRGNTSSARNGAFVGITCQGAVVNAININNNQVGNGVGGALALSVADSGAITGISNTVGSATCALTINNNNFQGFTYAAPSTGAFSCINTGGTTAIMLSQTINNNNFNNLTVNTSASTLGFLIGASNATPTVVINGNFVTTQFTNATPTGGANYIAIANAVATGPTTGSATISNNILSNITFRTTTSFGSAIYWISGSGASCTHNIIVDGNTISNISNVGVGTATQAAAIQCVQVGLGSANVISNNNVSFLTAAGGSVFGILATTVSTNPLGTCTVSNNIVHDLKTNSIYSGSAAGGAIGMQVQSGPAVNNIYKNKIYNLFAETVAPNLCGTSSGIVLAQATASSVTNVYNNIVGRLFAVNSIFYQSVRGINFANGNVANTANVYYNTVVIDSMPGGESYCVYMTNATPSLVLRNNILINLGDTTWAALAQMVIFRTGALAAGYSTLSNNNLLYIGMPGSLGYIYGDGAVSAITNQQQTLSAFQAFVGPTRENLSKTEIATPFLNTTDGSLATYLHIDPSVSTFVESGAVNIATYTDDYDGNIRQGNPGYAGAGSAPDIGADEGNFTQILVLPPASLSANSVSSSQIDLTFTPNGSSNNVVIVWNLTGTFTDPAGPPPSVGSPFAGGTLFYNGTSSPQSHTGLTSGTTYFYKAFSYNGAVYSPGVSASATVLLANDASTFSIDLGVNQNPGVIAPMATVKNLGTAVSTFNVHMTITGGYVSDRTATALASGASVQLTFDNWNAALGQYTVNVCTQLAGDQNSANDCLSKDVGVYTGSYSSAAVLPTTTYLSSGVAAGGKVYSIAGNTTSALGTECYVYDPVADTWTPIASLPAGRRVLATAAVGNFVYAIGGSDLSSVYQSTVYKYDIIGNSWSTVASMPLALGWVKAVAHGNNIYVAGGVNTSSTVVATVYMYDAVADTWASATSMPGPKFGGAFSITGNTLSYIAGANATIISNDIYNGVIDGGNPLTITWTTAAAKYPGIVEQYPRSSASLFAQVKTESRNTNPALGTDTYPPGAMYRFDGAPWGTDGIIVAGGSPTSTFTPAVPNPCYIYKPATDTWVKQGEIPVPVLGSSIGTVNTSGTTWKLVIASGLGTVVVTNATQVWTDNLAPATVTVNAPLAAGWNMISLPVLSPVGGSGAQQVYPDLLANQIFYYSGGYQPTATFTNGTGYWGKFGAAPPAIEPIQGTRDINESIPVVSGWNMVGSLTNDVATSTVTSVPPGLVTGATWFKYASGYVPTITLYPGGAFWVKTSGAGSVVLSNPPLARGVGKQESGVRSQESGVSVGDVLNSLTITDSRGRVQTLYFGADAQKQIAVERYAMPPMPPVGAFDARFETSEGGTLAQTHTAEATEGVEFAVKVQSDAYPLTVAWTVKGTAVYEVTDGLGGNVFRTKQMTNGSSIQITNSSLNRFVVKLVSNGVSLPKEFALSQNYPNPFNPTTNIKYALPVDSRVTMEIFNVIGQRVATLANEEIPAGYHSIEWNGTGNAGQQLGSGVYFLHLSAAGNNGKKFTEIRKLMMLK